jgi:hypothetical protein
MSQARSHWVLSADPVGKINGTWGGIEGGGREFVYANMPQHHGTKSKVPIGGNQSYVDGSAGWVKAEKMFFLTTWNTGAREYYFYQDPIDFDPTLAARLPTLKFKP